MTLDEFVNMIFTDTGECMVCIFTDDSCRDNYRKNPINGGLELAFYSPLKCNVFLNEKFANAKVLHFYPVDSRTVDVIIMED